MDFIYDVEDRDGIRWSLNIFPSTSVECKKLVVPLGCIYTPLKKGNTMRVNYPPILCNNCKNVINPFCQVDYSGQVKSWSCPFCGQRNQFPNSYSGITPNQLPAELHPFSTSIEYSVQRTQFKPAFLFILDVSTKAQSLDALKRSLIELIPTLPKDCHVGIMTFGSTVQVFELGFKYFPKTYMFDGRKDIKPELVQKCLNIGALGNGGKVVATMDNNIIIPVDGNEDHIISVIQSIQQDPVPTKPSFRPLLSTGVALSVAISVLTYTFPHIGAKAVLFTGGPCTQGPGLVVGSELSEPIRGFHQLNKELAIHVHSATKFYESLTSRAVTYSIAVDIFAASLDQVGLLEMKSLPKSTGGLIVQTEDFTRDTFKKSLRNYYKLEDEKLKLGFGATIEVSVSEEMAISGAIGHMTTGYKKNKSVSENELGIGGTHVWHMPSLDQSSSYSFYFDIKNPKDRIIPEGKNAMIQFRTMYNDNNGNRYLKVTTVAHTFVDTEIATASALLPGFDQEACASLVSRLALFKAENEDVDLIGWVDKHLINFAKRYGSYMPNQPLSFNLADEASLYPEFMFHFRRGPLVSTFGSSPDETVFKRYCFLRESTANTLIMIQPSLDSYSFNNSEPEAVLLATSSIQPDRILVLDTFFHVVIFACKTIASWRKQGYHENPQYESFAELLQVPVEDVQDILNDRFPSPLFVECDEGSSQARYLLSVIDPGPSEISGRTFSINTDDASLQTFMEHLKKYAVSSQ